MANGVPEFPHILLPDTRQTETFSRPGSPRDPEVSRVPDREAHARRLGREMNLLLEEARVAMRSRQGHIPANANGYYLKVASRPNEPLVTKQFEGKRAGVELLAVKQDPESGVTTASLFVPEKSAEFLEKKISSYENEIEPRSREGMPKHRRLIEGIGALETSSLRELWIDSPETFPVRGEVTEWEVWLRSDALEFFRTIAAELGIRIAANPLHFPEDEVIWAQCTVEQLERLLEQSASIARLGRAKKNSEFPILGTPQEQNLGIQELLKKLDFTPHETELTLCLLDTGVSRTHPLLLEVIPHDNCHAYDPNWGVDDHHGHGTKLAGICAFGDIRNILDDTENLNVPYRIESVNLFPPDGSNPHDLLAVITAGGVAVAELAKPNIIRVFCLASTTEQDTPHGGRPTSWSAELDQLASGASDADAPRRLFSVSAGNIRRQISNADYPNLNDISELEAPSHAWNVLCVGAVTSMDTISDATRAGWNAMAPAGNLTPSSRTASWNRTWPIKPDVVYEGGNFAVDPADGVGYVIDELSLITTSSEHPNPFFEAVSETSAAVAGVARLTAFVQGRYPHLWPETIRALIIDSAIWTPSMRSLLPTNPIKNDYIPLLRRYGFGVPSLERALQSADNDLTIIQQSELQPYMREGSKPPKLNEMKIFEIPWPVTELESLGNQPVSLKVTLSYFIEPNPAESARNRAARYASHGFRFAVKLPDENLNDFRRRINKAARDEEENGIHASDSGWMLGPTIRDRGSLHSDVWRGAASDLARRGVLAVYPIGGWWKERPLLEKFNERGRFSLIMRIDAKESDIDLYTAITNLIRIENVV